MTDRHFGKRSSVDSAFQQRRTVTAVSTYIKCGYVLSRNRRRRRRRRRRRSLTEFIQKEERLRS
jgi:hypothetical protein